MFGSILVISELRSSFGGLLSHTEVPEMRAERLLVTERLIDWMVELLTIPFYLFADIRASRPHFINIFDHHPPIAKCLPTRIKCQLLRTFASASRRKLMLCMMCTLKFIAKYLCMGIITHRPSSRSLPTHPTKFQVRYLTMTYHGDQI